jgi:hypothetical protein
VELKKNDFASFCIFHEFCCIIFLVKILFS